MSKLTEVVALKNISPKWCFHIVTYPPHFKYVDALIQSLLNLTDVRDLGIPIYVVVCNQKMVDDFNSNHTFDYDKIHVIHHEKIIVEIPLRIRENSQLASKTRLTNPWGAGGHRDYVAVKRSCSILFLKHIGFSHVWCLDSESKVLTQVSLQSIVPTHLEKPLLVVGNGKSKLAVRQLQIVSDIFKFDKNLFQDITVRMNDFWFINTSHFAEMIDVIMKKHSLSVSEFMLGCEQSVYEYYLYHKWLQDSTSVNLIRIEGNLHGNEMIGKAIKDVRTDLHKFSDNLNKQYFSFVKSYRGDYIRKINSSERGKELINMLDISIAVSNYQGT